MTDNYNNASEGESVPKRLEDRTSEGVGFDTERTFPIPSFYSHEEFLERYRI